MSYVPMGMTSVFDGLRRPVYHADTSGWGAWAHKGHRMWAAMPEEFWIHTYKVRRCPQPRSHDWTVCPFAHKGERARRRDTRRFLYVAASCPDLRPSPANQGAPICPRGLKCRYAHGVFELWLHPDRFRTRMCEAGPGCPRRICFFAHSRAELRPEDYMLYLPPPPPPLPLPRLRRAPAPPPRVNISRQIDMIVNSMPNLSISGGSSAASSSYVSRAVARPRAPAPAPAATTSTTFTALPSIFSYGGDWVTGYNNMRAAASFNSRSSEEIDESLMEDFPHYDLIMDLMD